MLHRNTNANNSFIFLIATPDKAYLIRIKTTPHGIIKFVHVDALMYFLNTITDVNCPMKFGG